MEGFYFCDEICLPFSSAKEKYRFMGERGAYVSHSIYLFIELYI